MPSVNFLGVFSTAKRAKTFFAQTLLPIGDQNRTEKLGSVLLLNSTYPGFFGGSKCFN